MAILVMNVSNQTAAEWWEYLITAAEQPQAFSGTGFTDLVKLLEALREVGERLDHTLSLSDNRTQLHPQAATDAAATWEKVAARLNNRAVEAKGPEPDAILSARFCSALTAQVFGGADGMIRLRSQDNGGVIELGQTDIMALIELLTRAKLYLEHLADEEGHLVNGPSIVPLELLC